MGLPVTSRMESAPPPRASPSILDMMTPSKVHALGRRLGDHVDDVLAGHGVHHHEDLVGLDRRLMASASCIISSSIVQAAGRVHDDHVAQVVDGVLDAAGAMAPASLPSPRKTAHADLAAEGCQLVGRGGTVRVAGGQQRAVALPA